eukprot:scaffold339040_cov37-Prasinocladus_malaysianus.AAC.2
MLSCWALTWAASRGCWLLRCVANQQGHKELCIGATGTIGTSQSGRTILARVTVQKAKLARYNLLARTCLSTEG